MPITHAKIPAGASDPGADVSFDDWKADHVIALVDADIPAAIARDAEVTASITTHAGAADPHGDRAFDTAAIATHAGGADPHNDRAFASAAVATHAGAGDPHPTYLTQAEADALYRAIGYVPTHASTTGQTADQHHAQLHAAAHAAGQPDVITPAAIAAAAAAHAHAPADVTGTAVITTDGRLSDSRNPLAHGAALHTDITRALFLPAVAAGLDVATLVNLGASPNLTKAVAYADAATNGAFWTFEVPEDWASGVITIQPIWSPGATDAVAHAVRWSMTCKNVTAGTTITAAGTNVLFTGAAAARTVGVVVKDTATSTTLTPAAAGDYFTIELQRIGADAADTYVGVVNLLGIRVTYTANQ
jgi:hypothetical protein